MVGPSCLYDIELVGRGHDLKRLKNVWEGLLSKATLVGHYEGQNTFSSRKDAFIRKGGLMSETSEVPWDVQMKCRSSGLHKRLQS